VDGYRNQKRYLVSELQQSKFDLQNEIHQHWLTFHNLSQQQDQEKEVSNLLARKLVEENHSHQQTQADLSKVNTELRETEEN